MGKPVDTETFVYVMARKNADGLSGPCKVGITSGLSGRLEQIRTASPFDVKLAAWFSFPSRSTAREVEQAFHAVKRELRLHGEWFDVEPKKAVGMLLAAIQTFLEVRIEVGPAALGEVWARILIDKDKWEL